MALRPCLQESIHVSMGTRKDKYFAPLHQTPSGETHQEVITPLHNPTKLYKRYARVR